jgi:small-conductance mechanosensitive channel
MSRAQAVDLRGAFDGALSSAAAFVPKLLGFLAILLVGWLIALLLRKVVKKLLDRAGFDHVVERGGLTKALGHGNYDASAVLAKLVYYAILLIALTMAFGVFGPNPVSNLLSAVVAFLPKAAIAMVIVLITAAIARAVRDLIGGILGGLSYARLMANLAGVFILGLGIIAALNQIGVATTVTTPVLITVLATIGGILVVGVGGGLIRPMQRRWERWLDVAEREGRNISHTVHYNRPEPSESLETTAGPPEAARDQPTEQFARVPSEEPHSTGR